MYKYSAVDDVSLGTASHTVVKPISLNCNEHSIDKDTQIPA